MENEAQAGMESRSQVHDTVDQIAGAIHRTVDKVAGGAAPAEQWLRDNALNIKYKEEELVSDLGIYIRENPFTAVGIGIAAGFLLSALIVR